MKREQQKEEEDEKWHERKMFYDLMRGGMFTYPW